jgi:hypothetical protein
MHTLWRMLMMSEPACRAGRWHGCYDTENGVLLMMLAGLPLAALLVWALAAVRSTTWRRPLAEVGLVYGTVPFVWITLMPGPGAGVVPGRLSLVPLRDLATMGPLGVGGNLLVLAALGFFAPIRFAALASAPRILALGAGCSALIEFAQFALRLDRVSSVDDVLVNATGALLAALASRRWWATEPGRRREQLARRGKPKQPGRRGEPKQLGRRGEPKQLGRRGEPKQPGRRGEQLAHREEPAGRAHARPPERAEPGQAGGGERPGHELKRRA